MGAGISFREPSRTASARPVASGPARQSRPIQKATGVSVEVACPVLLRPGKKAVIGNGLVIDPAALLSEIDALESAGVQIQGNLFVSNRAHVLFPAHRTMEKMSEGREGRVSIGTTSRGIGPCYEDKTA